MKKSALLLLLLAPALALPQETPSRPSEIVLYSVVSGTISAGPRVPKAVKPGGTFHAYRKDRIVPGQSILEKETIDIHLPFGPKRSLRSVQTLQFTKGQDKAWTVTITRNSETPFTVPATVTFDGNHYRHLQWTVTDNKPHRVVTASVTVLPGRPLRIKTLTTVDFNAPKRKVERRNQGRFITEKEYNAKIKALGANLHPPELPAKQRTPSQSG